ncbi:MAG: alpha/beta hydrolase [Chloroflexi bacterium]|nr:alpha/beta hydrolase [Chloroflexota bacterium]
MDFQRHENFSSQFVEPRHVDVWCPPGYDEGGAYPVIYMHDGQNLFAPSLAFGGVDWGVAEAMTRLTMKGMRGAIIVGIWNAGIRWREYMPQKHYENSLSTPMKEQVLLKSISNPISDCYLRFLVEELKPFIDSTYRTKPGQHDTFIMGSSMGGLISLYGISEYPNVFGGAGCVSTHWTAGGDELVNAMAAMLPDPATHKLYFDFGTKTLDNDYEPFQRKMDSYLAKAGYVENKNWLTLKFDGAEHSEKSWRERVEIPFAFLLG